MAKDLLRTLFIVTNEKPWMCLDWVAEDKPKVVPVARECVKKDDGKFGEWKAMPLRLYKEFFRNVFHLRQDKAGRNASGIVAIQFDQIPFRVNKFALFSVGVHQISLGTEPRPCGRSCKTIFLEGMSPCSQT
jgi:hypothetical protein